MQNNEFKNQKTKNLQTNLNALKQNIHDNNILLGEKRVESSEKLKILEQEYDKTLEEEQAEKAVKPVEEKPQGNITLMIDGMMCDHCVRFVTNALKSVDGVTDINVDLAGNKATVNSTEDKIEKNTDYKNSR